MLFLFYIFIYTYIHKHTHILTFNPKLHTSQSHKTPCQHPDQSVSSSEPCPAAQTHQHDIKTLKTTELQHSIIYKRQTELINTSVNKSVDRSIDRIFFLFTLQTPKSYIFPQHSYLELSDYKNKQIMHTVSESKWLILPFLSQNQHKSTSVCSYKIHSHTDHS